MFALTACWLALSTAALPTAPTRWVTDQANVLSPEVRTRLDAQLEAYERQTGHQLLVYVAPTTGGVPVEDLANEAFQAWGVGRTKLDDGAVLFVFPDDRTARIEVGYGLEERLTDAMSSRIINEVLGPGMAAGKADVAISQSVELMMRVIGGEGGPEPGQVAVRRPPTPLEVGLIVVAGVGLLLLFWRHPGLALFLLSILFRRGGGGGGFGGGGGRSGGGGATGRW